MMQSMTEYFVNPVRKLAHFCEYAVMGVLLFLIWYPWVGWKGKNADAPESGAEGALKKKRGFWRSLPKLAKIIVPWVFVSAAFDEIHQLFVPGRFGNVWDVLLDTSGGCFGLLLCVLVMKLDRRMRERRVVAK